MCGLVGIVANHPVNQEIYDALTVLQHRGQDSSGIMTDDNGVLCLRKSNGLVSDVAEYGLEDGRVVAIADRETPTRGRELTFLEQLLGNVGRLPTEQFGGEQNLPGGAGGPRRDQ